jgi:flagellar M-ring protein FliF
MEPLLAQLRSLPTRLAALPATTRRLLYGGAGLALLVAIGVMALRDTGSFQYAFTNLTPEDGAQAAATLTASGMPHRLEAGGTALAVPADKVYDARLMLAAAGIPRAGGVGFELFDRGDFGVTEFTQKVNLRRALEGELARTVGSLAEVKGARVHLTLPERGLFRDEDREASAAVVLNLQPGRLPGERELAGIRHLVASAVPGLQTDAVTIVDGRGAILSDTDTAAQGRTEQRKMEREIEARLVSLLEPVVGEGRVVARVTAQLDDRAITSKAEVVDPDATALKAEKLHSSNASEQGPAPGGVVGAAANDPASLAGAGTGTGRRGTQAKEEQERSFDVSRTITTTATASARLTRLSVAVLVDGLEGKPRDAEELSRLTELSRNAVGFDVARGDQLHLTSVPFRVEPEAVAIATLLPAWVPPWGPYAGGAGLLALLAAAAFVLVRRRKPAVDDLSVLPGTRVGAALGELQAVAPKLPEGPEAVRERARQLVAKDPQRAARLLKAWIAADLEAAEREKEREHG